MVALDVQEYRVERMKALLETKFDGKFVALGRALGYDSGAFVSQMVKGLRRISEDTVQKAEALPGCAGWFATQRSQGPVLPRNSALTPPAPTLEQALEVLGIALANDLPDDVREDLADAMARLVKRKGLARVQADVLQLLRTDATPSKRYGT